MAAQPPRPPPNNLLFCGPPPTLPTVVLLPSDVLRDINSLDAAPDPNITQTNEADGLKDINNVGVPTYEEFFGDQVNTSVLNPEQQLTPNSYLRRTQSFDISDIYAARFANDNNNARAYRPRASEPDLSKFGLFLEAEVTVECGPHEPPPLVLNNPFYDGSYAINPSQINQGMVMMPENYLAFEDAFVPWKFKPELLIDRDASSDMYYDGLPLIPTNDPWSTYGAENAGFEYYTPQFVAPIGEQDGIHYMPLADFEYAIPQYMSLPTIEQANIETFSDTSCQLEEIPVPSYNEHNTQDVSNSFQPEIVAISAPATVSSNVVSEDEKGSVLDSSTNRESSTRSEESFNADISNDVTSSLAFMPSSKSSQVPRCADDTSDDTSPCSTDYQEASALDLVQSLDELSCSDSNSTDFSQSRDDASPSFPDAPKPNIIVTNEVGSNRNDNDGTHILESNEMLTNVPLNKLPSIPIHSKLLSNLPPVPNSLLEKELTSHVQSPQQSVGTSETLVIQNEAKENKCNDRSSDLLASEAISSQNIAKIPQPPHPPAVPTAWLEQRPSNSEKTATVVPECVSQNSVTQVTPQIHVQSTELQPPHNEKSVKPPLLPPTRTNEAPAGETQPSCSYVAPIPGQTSVQTSQLKPKEVESEQSYR